MYKVIITARKTLFNILDKKILFGGVFHVKHPSKQKRTGSPLSWLPALCYVPLSGNPNGQ